MVAQDTQIDLDVNPPKETVGNADATVQEEIDPYALVDDFKPSGTPWNELDGLGKVKRVSVTTSKFIILLGLLYLFICSLGFLGDAFKLLGGKAAGDVFTSNVILNNPVSGLMIGLLGTVLLQSSSTSTSITVSMVASGILPVRPAIPIIMGANIGTSVTNTIVAITQIGDKTQFRRAFAGATVHDMFNLLSVAIILPLELITGYLFHMTDAMVEAMDLKSGDKAYKKELLKKITKPFTNLFVQLDKKVVTKWSHGEGQDLTTMLKFWCDKPVKTVVTLQNVTVGNMTSLQNVTSKVYSKPCEYIFHDSGMSDTSVGVVMLIIALFILCTCLVLIVKLLHSLLKGKIASIIRNSLNSDFPKPFGFLTGYVAILIGAGMTILVQSSSIFTSAVTPLVGIGVISIDRMYPLTLGSNIGTTATSILAALASSSDKLAYALQISLCHLFFNISGIILFYPVPTLRKVPVKLARALGNTTAEFRWFAIAYLIVCFGLIPLFLFGISLAGWKVFLGIFVPIVALILFIVVVNIMQSKKSEWLPGTLKSWEWLPLFLRSLKPYDKLFTVLCVNVCKKTKNTIRSKNVVVSA